MIESVCKIEKSWRKKTKKKVDWEVIRNKLENLGNDEVYFLCNEWERGDKFV